MSSVESLILQTVDKDGVINDSGEFASTSGYDHADVVGCIKSLQSYEMVIAEASVPIHALAPTPSSCSFLIDIERDLHVQEVSHSRYVLLEEAIGYRDHGSPEAQVHAAVPPEGIPMKDLPVSKLFVVCNCA